MKNNENETKSSETKFCPRCNKLKSIDEFHIKRASKDGLHNVCKSCVKIQNDKRYITHEEEMKTRSRGYSLAKYREDPEKARKYNRPFGRKYMEENREMLYKQCAKYHIERYHYDPEFRLRKLLRGVLYRALKTKGWLRGSTTNESIVLLGCDYKFLREHLESQFKPEMTWENHGTVWEIDHIIPIASFNLIDHEQQKQCFHYSNIQPLFKTTEIAINFGYENEIGNRDKSRW